MAQFDCLRCGTAMRFVGQEKLQLGQASWLLGDWPNLVAGALEVSIMACPYCGKLEFFSGGGVAPTVDSPAATTPACTSADARNAALPTISTIPNVPCAAILTGRRMNFKTYKIISG